LIAVAPDVHHADYAEEWTPLPPGKKLKCVVVLHRHGDRTPVTAHLGANYHFDDHRKFWEPLLPSNEAAQQLQSFHPWLREQVGSHGPEKAVDDPTRTLTGQLTQRGLEQLTSLGSTLRDRYVGAGLLLPDVMEPNDIIGARSTPLHRCYQSLAGLLMGLYPPEHRGEYNVVPITSRNGACETMWDANESCGMVKAIKDKADADFEADPPIGYPELLGTLVEAFGIDPEDNQPKLLKFGEIVGCFRAHGRLPIHILPRDAGKLNELRDLQFFNRYKGTDLAFFTGGRLLIEIATCLRGAAETTAPGKIAFFSAHDTTVIPILYALGADIDAWPGYASSVVFELFEDVETKEQHVRALYNGRAVKLTGQSDAMTSWAAFEADVVGRMQTGWGWFKACQAGKPRQ
jgi:acid phosphatase